MILTEGHNGNAHIVIYENGSRHVEFDGELRLDYPLNVDIKLSDRCPFGLNPVTKKAVCEFCHESAQTDGQHGQFDDLIERLVQLPPTTEIAVGINQVDDAVIDFLARMRGAGYIVNATVNQGLVQTGAHNDIVDLVHGIGISFRSLKWNLTDPVYRNPNTVVHVIAGIDDFETVKSLNAPKILVLGEKDFGFNTGQVNTQSENHLTWFRRIHELFDTSLVSFDNLAIEQLKIRRFFREDSWNTFFQGEHSIYINAVTGTYAPSSRSSNTLVWDIPIRDYFQQLEGEAV